MEFTSIITDDWEITVPPEVLALLGVGPGDQIEFDLVENRTVLRPCKDRSAAQED